MISMASLCVMQVLPMRTQKKKELSDKEIKQKFENPHKDQLPVWVQCAYCQRHQMAWQKFERSTFTLYCKFTDCGETTLFWDQGDGRLQSRKD